MRIRARIDGYALTYRKPALAVVRKTAGNVRAHIDGKPMALCGLYRMGLLCLIKTMEL